MTPIAPEIIKADKSYRNRLFLCYAGGLAVVGVTAAFAVPWLKNYAFSLPLLPAMVFIERVLIVFLLLFIPAATYLIVVGGRIIRHERAPYPGMKVIRDTPVLMGARAVFRGKTLRVLGIVSIVFSIAGSAATHVVFGRIRAFYAAWSSPAPTVETSTNQIPQSQ